MKDAAFMLADGKTPATSRILDDILAGALDTPVKFAFRSTGTEAWNSTMKAYLITTGGSDGSGQLRIGVDTTTLSPPWNVAGVASGTGAGGGWSAPGIKAIVVTVVNATGETVASAEAQVFVRDVTQIVSWSWSYPTLAGIHFDVHRRELPGGTYDSPSLIASTTDNFFDDDGTAPGAGAPPDANTTGGPAPAYLTSLPSFDSGPALIGVLEPGRQAYIAIKRVIDSNVDPKPIRFAKIRLLEG